MPSLRHPQLKQHLAYHDSLLYQEEFKHLDLKRIFIDRQIDHGAFDQVKLHKSIEVKPIKSNLDPAEDDDYDDEIVSEN